MGKQFDYAGAKQEGYSDEEIMQHLSQNRPKFDLQGALKEGYSPSEINEYLIKNPPRSKFEKAGRLATQYGIGAAETALFPYEVAVSPLASKKAQHGEYRQRLFEDIERLQEQKSAGQWDEEDQNLYNSLIKQIQKPEEAKKFVKTADLGIAGLAEKASGLDLQPEGIGELVGRIGGNILKPKQLASLPKFIKNLANKEARQAIKTEKQWLNLDRAAKGKPEKETLLKFAKSHELTPQETSLLFHSEGQAKLLEKLAKKSKKLKGTIQGLKDKLGKNYEDLKALGKTGGMLNAEEADVLTDNLYKILQDTGKTFVEGPDTAAARKVIENSIERIANRGGTVEDLINSRQGLKQGINWRNVDQGDVIKSRADQAFMQAIKDKNPAVYQSLLDTDKAYAKYKQFSKVLKEQAPVYIYKGIPLPSEYGNYLTFGLSTLFTSPIGALKILGLKEITQRLLTEAIINPKLKAPFKRMQEAAVKGSKKGQKQAFLVIKNLIKDEDPEFYKEIKDLKID